MMAKQFIKLVIITASCLAFCRCEEKNAPESKWQDTPNHINLFHKSDQTQKLDLTKDQAFAFSKLVVVTNEIKYLDKTLPERTQGGKVVYLYKIESGAIAKSPAKAKIKFPIYFTTTKLVVRKDDLSDSIPLYLKPLEENKILQKYLKVNWQLLESMQ